MANNTNSNVAPRLFAYLAHGCDLTTALTTKYNDSLIFIGDEKQIYSPAMKTYVGIGMTAYTNTLTYAGYLGRKIDKINDSMNSAIVSHINGQGDAHDLAESLLSGVDNIKVIAADGTEVTGTAKTSLLSVPSAFGLSGDVSIRGINDSDKTNPNLAYSTYLLTFKSYTGDQFYVERPVTTTYNGKYASSGINVSTVESTYTCWIQTFSNGSVKTSIAATKPTAGTGEPVWQPGIGVKKELIIDDRATWSYIASAYAYSTSFAREWATAEANRIYANILGETTYYVPVSYEYAIQSSETGVDASNNNIKLEQALKDGVYYKAVVDKTEYDAETDATAKGIAFAKITKVASTNQGANSVIEVNDGAAVEQYWIYKPLSDVLESDGTIKTGVTISTVDTELNANNYPIMYQKGVYGSTYNTNLADGINTLKEVAYLLDVLTDGIGSFEPTYDKFGNFTGYTTTSSDNLGIKMAYSIATTQQEINLSNNRINELETGANTLRSLSTSNSKYVNIVTESTHRTSTYTAIEGTTRGNHDITLNNGEGVAYSHSLEAMMGDSNLTVRLNVANTYITARTDNALYVQVAATELVEGTQYYTATTTGEGDAAVTTFSAATPTYDVHKDSGTTWYVKNAKSSAAADNNISYNPVLNEELDALLTLYTYTIKHTGAAEPEDSKYAALGISGVTSKATAQDYLDNLYVVDGTGYKKYTQRSGGTTATGASALTNDYTTAYQYSGDYIIDNGLVAGEDYIIKNGNNLAYSVANNDYIYYLDFDYAVHTAELYYRRDNGAAVEHAELTSGLVATTDWVSAYMFQEDQSITDKLQELKIATYSFAKQVGGAINSSSEGSASQYAFRHVQQSGKVQLMYREMPQDTVSSSTVVYDPTTVYTALDNTVAAIAGASLNGKKLYVVDAEGSEYLEFTDADYTAAKAAAGTANSISDALSAVNARYTGVARKVKDNTMVYVYDEAKREFITYKKYVYNQSIGSADNKDLFKQADATTENGVALPTSFNIFDTTHAGFVKLYYKGTKFVEVKAETLDAADNGTDAASIKTVDNHTITLSSTVKVYTTSTTDKHTDYITTSTKHFSSAEGGKGQNHTDIQLHVTKLADAVVDNTGLADAYDVRSFIENLCSWVDISATVKEADADAAIGKAARYNPLNTASSLYTQANAIRVNGANTQGAEGADNATTWANRDSRFDGIVNDAPASGSATTTAAPVTTTAQP